MAGVYAFLLAAVAGAVCAWLLWSRDRHQQAQIAALTGQLAAALDAAHTNEQARLEAERENAQLKADLLAVTEEKTALRRWQEQIITGTSEVDS
ncbi:hypothetical protein ACIBHX_01635 [Nonomuraea sp. NPDC050536]|uniref:hypothetical protein n=1 Tax=Nonomuraea sp. NPDC050536 TaxID=3364366 RepID=UPI0037CC3502